MKAWISIALLVIPFALFAQNFPEKSSRLVNDYTKTLSNSDVRALEQKLVAYEQESSVQIAIVEMIKGLMVHNLVFSI